MIGSFWSDILNDIKGAAGKVASQAKQQVQMVWNQTTGAWEQVQPSQATTSSLMKSPLFWVGLAAMGYVGYKIYKRELA